MKKLIVILCISITLLFASELHISFTGNNRGLLDPCGCNVPSGGMSRISTMIHNMETPNLQIGAGNHFFHHSPMPKEDQIFEQMKAAFQAEVYSDLGYDAINIGQFDLCYGLKVLQSIQERFDLPFISANLLDNEGHLAFPPYKIIHSNNIDIVFIGICQLSNGHNFRIKDPLETLIELHDNGIFELGDLVILLADAPAKTLSEFVKEYGGIDLIVAAKEHAYTGLPVHYNNTALVQLGSQGKYFGTLHLNFQEDIREWKDITVYKHYVKTAQDNLNTEAKQKKKYKRNLKRHKSILSSQIKKNKTNYSWEFKLLDSSVKDDPNVKKRVEKYTRDL
jgi:2',3'-cyclic-nucleotide 2'-phosphodiesterase (5'-nucleotidase family)